MNISPAIFQFVGLALGALAALAALLVVPEVRRILGLDRSLGHPAQRGEGSAPPSAAAPEPAPVPVRPGRPIPVRVAEAREPEEGVRGWVVCSSGAFLGAGLPARMVARVHQLAAAGRPVVRVALGPARAWWMRDATGETHEDDLPDSLCAALSAHTAAARRDDHVIFGPAPAWVLLRAGQPPTTHCVPGDLDARLASWSETGQRVRHVGLGPDNGAWATVLGRNGFRTSRASRKLRRGLLDLNERQEDVRRVVLLPNRGWIVLYGDNGFAARRTPEDLRNALDHCRSAGDRIHDLAWWA